MGGYRELKHIFLPFLSTFLKNFVEMYARIGHSPSLYKEFSTVLENFRETSRFYRLSEISYCQFCDNFRGIKSKYNIR